MDRLIRISLVNHSLHSISLGAQRHEANELIYVLSPGYQLQVADTVYRLGPGQMLLIGYGVEHRLQVRPDRQTTCYVLQWHDSNQRIETAIGPLEDHDGRVLVLLRWLEELTAQPDSVERERRLTHLLQPLLDQVLALQEGGATTTLAERVLAAMVQDHGHPITLADLAGNFGLSSGHLARRFKAETGETIGRALTRIRLEHALALLSGTDLPLGVISERVGISSVPHLSRLIRRHTGRTASQLRCARRGPKP